MRDGVADEKVVFREWCVGAAHADFVGLVRGSLRGDGAGREGVQWRVGAAQGRGEAGGDRTWRSSP